MIRGRLGRVAAIGLFTLGVMLFAPSAPARAQQTCSAVCPDGTEVGPFDCERGPPRCPSSRSQDDDSDRRRQQQNMEQQRLQQIRRQEEERRQAAATADKAGLEAAAGGDWRAALDHFRNALQLSPNDASIRAHLNWAAEGLADAGATEKLQALRKRVHAALEAETNRMRDERAEDDIAARRLALMRGRFQQGRADGRTTITTFYRPNDVYPGLAHPVPPGSPVAKALASAQPTIAEVDIKIRRAQAALRQLIQANGHNDVERAIWVKSSEEATREAVDLSFKLTGDLFAARLDGLRKENEALRAAHKKLTFKKADLDRRQERKRLADSLANLQTRIRGISSEDPQSRLQEVWNVAIQFEKINDLAGPAPDLIDAAYTIYKQAVSYRNLSVIQHNQEQSLTAANSLRQYVIRLQAQKAALSRSVRP